MAVTKIVVIDSLRPNLACFENPPKKSKDKCEVELKLHREDSKYILYLSDSMGGLGGAALGVGIPFLLQGLAGEERVGPGGNRNSPPKPPPPNPESRNPTSDYGP